ncbi:B12-binding domain-containing protein [Myxococcota bacterium]|nr:B12-binding domain-containing protein [Myxococcota bacterium]
MILWCAYCQRYRGERAPFDDYSMTHGMCERCEAADMFDDPRAIDRLAPLRTYYHELRALAGSGRSVSPHALLRRGLALGVEPADLAVGMLQPLLHEVGDRWYRGELTVAQEHHVTAMVAAMFELFYVERPELGRLRQVLSPHVLLLAADGNSHELGLKLIQLLLVSRGFGTYLVSPGLPVRESVALTRAIGPKILGISVSLERQLPAAYAIARELARFASDERPVVCVGGGPILRGVDVDRSTGLIPIANVEGLVPLLAA